MKLTSRDDFDHQTQHYHLEISYSELIKARFDNADRMVLASAEKTISDVLVGLEIITRRIEQAYESGEGGIDESIKKGGTWIRLDESGTT